MRWHGVLLAALAAAATPGAASAQPADLSIPPATTTEYPAGISVGKTKAGPVYVDAKGRTLYGLDMRLLQRWSPNPALYCKNRCEEWEPILAPADAKPNIVYPKGFGSRGREAQAKLADQGFHVDPQTAPDWTIIEGPNGPQWVYKGWHMVYARKGDKPGSTAFDGAEDFVWNTLKFVPPVPEIIAPAHVTPLFVDGKYALAFGGEQLLYTGKCAKDCSDWEPLAAGMASRGLGEWKVDRNGDVPQWTYRGKPVFVSRSGGVEALPASGEILRP